MKRLVLPLLSLVFVLISCEETPPFIDFSEPVQTKDTTYISGTVATPQHKAVLIEDITGVRCNNCPAAALEAVSILNKKTDDSVVVMALYAGDYLTNFTTPWKDFPVLNSNASNQILSQLGVPTGLPNGYVDRAIFGAQTSRVNAYKTWGSLVDERLRLTTPVNISLQKSIAGRILTLKMKLEYTSSVSGTQKYALYLTESEIVSKQTTLTSYDENYVHNHVLRESIGNAVGIALTETLIPGRVFEKEVDFDIPADYDIQHCHIVCVITDSVTEEVINVRQIDLK